MFVVTSVATDTRAVGEQAAVAIGATVMLGALWGGPISGASMNPARSLGAGAAGSQLDGPLDLLAGTDRRGSRGRGYLRHASRSEIQAHPSPHGLTPEGKGGGVRMLLERRRRTSLHRAAARRPSRRASAGAFPQSIWVSAKILSAGLCSKPVHRRRGGRLVGTGQGRPATTAGGSMRQSWEAASPSWSTGSPAVVGCLLGLRGGAGARPASLAATRSFRSAPIHSWLRTLAVATEPSSTASKSPSS